MNKPDFIIVGSGSAGSVVAERLSANGKHSVTVLEAGGTDQRFYVQMPLGYGKTFFDPDVNWMYRTEPDAGLAGQQDFWPRGKVLGGSSSINAMVWCRGAPEDYDEWEDAGNPGWGWKEMLRVYREIEDNEEGGNVWRGSGGPLRITPNRRHVHSLTHNFVEAAGQAGLPFNGDFNGASQEGAGYYQLTTRNGRRLSTARAFLRPAMKRRNVEVITGALATRILFEGRRAVGVEYVRNGMVERLRAGREVIVSGGSINSPQLLQLSGIGPGAHLASLGIDTVLDNGNVGANLQDHQGINYTYQANTPTLNQVLRPWFGKLLVGMQYLLLRSGPLSISLNHGGGFFRTRPDLPRPNMQLYFQSLSTVIPKPGERPLLTPDPFPGFSIGLSNCRPTSRGDIMIRSADPREAPRIAMNAFSTNEDVSEMLDAVKFIRKIAAQPALRALIEREILPGEHCVSDADIVEDFRRRSGTVFHPVSTCRMGPDPKGAVVDSRLKVHGVGGLRVIDASVFPNLVAGNTNAAAIATGWRGAELILEEIG